MATRKPLSKSKTKPKPPAKKAAPVAAVAPEPPAQEAAAPIEPPAAASEENAGRALLDRIDIVLHNAGKGRTALTKHLHVSGGLLSQLGRNNYHKLSDIKMAETAKFLGVNLQWLQDGTGPRDSSIGPLTVSTPAAPKEAKKVKGAKLVKSAKPLSAVDNATTHHMDAAMRSLWSVAPLDVKALFIAKMAELFATHARAPQ